MKKFISQSTNLYLKELRCILEQEKAKKYVCTEPLQHTETANKTQTAKTGQQLEIEKERMGEEIIIKYVMEIIIENIERIKWNVRGL